MVPYIGLSQCEVGDSSLRGHQAYSKVCCSQNRLHQPLQTSNMLCSIARNGSTNLYKLHTCFSVDKIDSPILYKLPPAFAAVKTASPNLYKPPSRFAVVTTDPTNLYKLHTSFLVDKTHSTDLYKLYTHFVVDKKKSSNFIIKNRVLHYTHLGIPVIKKFQRKFLITRMLKCPRGIT